MRVLQIINRLKTQCVLLQQRVEAAQSLTALSDEELQYELPIAFVYSGKETAGGNNMINSLSQFSPTQFSVLIAAKNSDGINEYLEDVRDQIKSALLGFEIDSHHEQIGFVEGDIIDISKRVVWWKDTFETSVLLSGIL